MSGGPKGARRSHHEEEHENHERWAVSYADMVTVLMCLFIVLFAISQVDAQKFLELRNGLAAGFGNNSTVPVDGGSGLLANDGQKPNPTKLRAIAKPNPVELDGNGQGGQAPAASGSKTESNAKYSALVAAADQEYARLIKVQASLTNALSAQGLAGRVNYRISDRGLVVSVVADAVFFEEGSAQITPKGLQVLNVLSPVITSLPQEVAVEGHANHIPVSNAQYPSNWELSAGRAASVVRYLIQYGVPARRLSATGFGESRPLVPPEDPNSLNANRRVDLVVLSTESSSVRALLPQVAAAHDSHTAVQDTGQAAGEAAATEKQNQTVEKSTATHQGG